MSERLGRIQKIHVGYGGYDDAMFGVAVTLGGDSWAVSDWDGPWTTAITSGTKWTEADRSHHFDTVMRRLWVLCKDAKVKRVEDLCGKPVMVMFDGGILKSWRLLTEVL